jgi:hypothetical protein
VFRRKAKKWSLDDVVELMNGFGVMLQTIDARLEDIIHLLEEEGDGEEER